MRCASLRQRARVARALADRLVDSDVLIDSLRGFGDTGQRMVSASLRDTLFTTAINVFELERGARTAEEISEVRDLLDKVTVLELDRDSAREAASIDRELRAAGIRLDTRDTLIAGVARNHRMPLITRNSRHFDRIPGLVVEEL
ncbi:MAG: hypothetical protein C0506_02425 [Anaerolinea sp.]|nr:hypothetical protein [Anaerolinea sp.]